ncbi:DNA cytosine methyltransferase [Nocardia aurea]|uniref:DNA cytosine methyltransferase n=1 Tax=Nocardia aurea TaxID=2144174 RepID=UPI0033B01E06
MLLHNEGLVPLPPGSPTAIDLFCGAGGLTLGLHAAGFDCRAAIDIDEAAVATFAKNIGDHVKRADASKVTGEELLDAAGVAHGELDLLAGGPPCQGFSKQKRGAHLGDPRNALVLEHLRLIEEVRPRAFLLENVAMLASIRGAHLVERFHSLADYQLVGHSYLAADYGVAQTRQRFVMVGIRNDQLGTFTIPSPTTPVWPTVGETLDGLPEPPADGSEHPNFANHRVSRMNAANVERFSYVPQGGGWQDIPFEKRLKCHQVVNVKAGGWPDVYGRLRWEGQAPTITGGFDSVSRGRYGHPIQNRALTPREAARLQGFPDWFAFVGTRHDVRHQIGNAVPAPLGMAIGQSIREALAGVSAQTQAEGQMKLFGG